MVMDAKSSADDAAAKRKMFKHMGEFKTTKTPVIVLFRTVPEEENNCLVVAPKFLPDVYNSALMRTVESDQAQESDELGTYLARQYFPDGVNMLSMLHRDNFIKKQPTSEIIITYGLSDDGRVQLDELNKMIAKEKGVKVSELAEQNASSEDLADEKKETKKDAKKTSKKN
jgi:hypothetical protein